MSEAYKSAGVDIAAGELFAQMIKERIARAWGAEAAEEIGGFAGGGRIPAGARIVKASVDGVGTKLHLLSLVDMLQGLDMLETAGRDAVAMATDTYYDGNTIAFALDHLSVERLEPERHIRIINGVIAGCIQAGCVLVGGETAEEPGTYRYPWRFNLDVTTVGFPNSELAFDPVEEGQYVYGWESDFPGANGFSLLREIFRLKDSPSKVRRRLESYWPELGDWLGKALLGPTPIWVRDIEGLRRQGVRFAGHAHITGGGMVGNIPRILPDDLKVVIHRDSWKRPRIFRVAEELGKISNADMERTFNQGVMVVSIDSGLGEPITIPSKFSPIKRIGYVARRKDSEPQVEFTGEYNDG